MASHVPDFYITAAERSFRNAYGDDPNVVSVRNHGTCLVVSVVDVNEGWYPTLIDGVTVLVEPSAS